MNDLTWEPSKQPNAKLKGALYSAQCMTPKPSPVNSKKQVNHLVQRNAELLRLPAD